MISSLDREARFSIIGFNYESSPWRTRLVNTIGLLTNVSRDVVYWQVYRQCPSKMSIDE